MKAAPSSFGLAGAGLLKMLAVLSESVEGFLSPQCPLWSWH